MTGTTKKRKRPSKKDAGFRLAKSVGAYLETVGWRALVVGPMQVRGLDLGPDHRIGRYEFVVKFTGGRIENKRRT